jgi:8-oxo-dGTP diphosphatase
VTPEVFAAGGILHRRRRRGAQTVDEVAVVHRPRYDDWSFPKGKRDGDESDEETALREVEEETGFRCMLGREVGETRYVDNKGRDKVVRYWLMDAGGAAEEPGCVPNHEVDELRWLTPCDAGRLLSYEHDRELLREVGFDLGAQGGDGE